MAYLQGLAARFVEQDGLSAEEQDNIITEVADYVRSGHGTQRENAGSPAMQLAQSIQRWVSSTNDDDGDENGTADSRNIERTARAHRFLSRTLKALPPATLKATEVKLFTNFFCAMYQLQDASISAVTEALNSLVSMDKFDSTSADAILSSIGSIEHENFTKQVAKTRLEIFKLIESLLSGRSGRALQSRHKDSEHLLTFLELAGRERDPFNLLQWFRMLSTSLRQSNLSNKVADAVFDSFSPFFPISIRMSTATGPEVTEKQLKEALSSCFAANGQLAHRAIPFLVGKLDDSSSLTAWAKLDILRTINACVKEYEPIDTYVLPYIPQIWASLKYEVRNGEVPEIIRETLSIFETASARLAHDSTPTHLKDFVDMVWNDCAEDFLDNPAYTEQLGSILISVAGAHLEPYRLVSPRIITTVRRAMAEPKSPAHTKTILLVLNNLLRARRHVVPELSTTPSLEVYGDDPVSLLSEVYFKALKDNAVEKPNKDQITVAKEALEGLSQIVQQRRPSDDRRNYTTDCDEDTFKEICSILTYHCANCFNIPAGLSAERKEVEKAATEALRTTVKYYPEGYAKMASATLDEVSKRNWTATPTERSFQALHMSCQRLAVIGCTVLPEDSAALVNVTIFAGSMLKMLGELSASQATFQTRAYVASAILDGLQKFAQIEAVRSDLQTLAQSSPEKTTWNLSKVDSAVRNMLPGFPDLVKGASDQFRPAQMPQLVSNGPRKSEAYAVPFLQIGVFVVMQLYLHATEEQDNSETSELGLSDILKVKPGDPDVELQILWRDRYLEKIGSIAAVILQELGVSAQNDLVLHDQVLACFRPTKAGRKQLCWSYHSNDAISLLSWGVALAIRPEVVLNLHGKIYDILLGAPSSVSRPAYKAWLCRARVAIVLANKYDTRSCSSKQDLDDWTSVLKKIEDTLRAPSMTGDMSLRDLSYMEGILWGAIARGDRSITKSLSEAIADAAVKSGRIGGNNVARDMAQIVLPMDRVSDTISPAHTIEKRLHKQWAYFHCIQPVLQKAYPLHSEDSDSVTYAIYVLNTVQHLTLAQYESDAEKVLRIALASMQKAEYPEVDAAFTIVLHIVNQDPKLVKDHVASIVTACKQVYVRAAKPSGPAPRDIGDGSSNTDFWKVQQPGAYKLASGKSESRDEIRRKSVRLLKTLCKQLNEVESRAYAGEVMVHLEEVLGDQRRHIRQLAQVAKRAWASLLD